METTSFAARRPAATALPGAFTLPPPPPAPDMPRALGDSLSPSGMHSGSSQNSQPGMYSYQMPAGQWPQPGSSHSHSYSYTAHSSSANSSSATIVPPSSSYHTRPVYNQVSPHVPSFPSRQSPTPAAGETLSTQSSYPDQQQFPASLAQSLIGSQAPSTAAQQPTPASSAGPSPTDPSYRPSQNPAPQYYAPTSTPQQSSYPSFAPQPSPPMPSPTTAGGLGRGLSLAPPHLGYPAPTRPPTGYSTYGQGYLGGVAHHGAPLMMGIGPGMGGMPGYPPPHLHHMYPSHGGPPVPPQDRPFKCDSCQQSFNRNHDLKRHKRIHLAVKPFPCTFCEKTFSRKDALKRHRLVKGCGKTDESAGPSGNSERSPPAAPDDSGAEMMDEHSPRRFKEEM